MTPTRRLCLASAFALALAGKLGGNSLAAPSAVTDPAALVRRLYTIAGGKKGQWDGPAPLLDPAFRKQYFSKGFQEAMTRMEAFQRKTGDVILDFDPVSSSQDPSVEDLKISQTKSDASLATVLADFHRAESKDRIQVLYDFIREGGDWKLDDIQGSVDGDKWSVRDLIKQGLA